MSHSDDKQGAKYPRPSEDKQSPLELAAPVIIGVLPGKPEGLLPASALANDLTISVLRWTNLPPDGTQDTLVFEWRRQNTTGAFLPLQEYIINGPLSDADFPLSRLIDAGKLDGFEGAFDFRYSVITYNGGSSDPAVTTPLVIDRTPPYGAANPEALIPDALQITNPYLDATGDLFFCTIPEYSDLGDGDKVAYYWIDDKIPDDVSGLQPIGIIDVPLDMKLVFTRSQIEAVGNHTCYAVYILVDKAGNTSRVGASPAIDVTLIARNLPYPNVLEASGVGSTSSLLVTTAANGVTIKIPKGAVIYNGETVKASWGEPGKLGFFEGAVIVQPDDQWQLKVPKEYVPQHMGHDTAVIYKVKPLVGDEIPSDKLTVKVSMISGGAMPYGQCAVTQVSFANYPAEGLEVKLLARWFLIMPGQHVRIWAAGVPAGRADAKFTILDDVEVTQGHINSGFITGAMTKAQVSAFKVSSSFKIYTSYSFDGKETWIDENDSPGFTMQLIA